MGSHGNNGPSDNIVVVAIGTIAAILAVFSFLTGYEHLPDMVDHLSSDPVKQTEPPPYTPLSRSSSVTPNPTAIRTTQSSIYELHFCDRPCAESNAAHINRARESDHIHANWTLPNLPDNTPYKLIWSVNHIEWAKFNCVWNGTIKGQSITLDNDEKIGGDWTLAIEVNSQSVISATVSVPGSYTNRITPLGEKPCPDLSR